MQDLTPEGQRVLEEIAQRHGVSLSAAMTLLHALAAGGGTQAQFNHPELGGMGQWSQGGMIMIGDMFNQGLKYRVDILCNELAGLLRSQPFRPAAGSSQAQGQGDGGVSLFVPGSGASFGQWWPSELGGPASSGAQNDLRYAFFPASRRLAIQQGGRVSVYDTGAHQISGFSQQQSGDQSLTFTSQFGLVRVADLPLVSPQQPAPPEAAPVVETVRQAPAPIPEPIDPAPPPASAGAASADDILSTIERLAELRRKDILTEEEFTTKKAALLARL